jgi:hypothetical protein
LKLTIWFVQLWLYRARFNIAEEATSASNGEEAEFPEPNGSARGTSVYISHHRYLLIAFIKGILIYADSINPEHSGLIFAKGASMLSTDWL